MIAVRIPEEIRKYKEKIMFGLNARQLVTTLIALLVCVPLYFFGRGYLTDDILSWIIILIAVPLLAIGFFRFNGMPMERFVMAILKYALFFPTKRKYKVENAFRDWQNEAIKEELPRPGVERIIASNIALQGSLERIVLLQEAEERGDMKFDADTADLITVSKHGSGGRKPKKDKNDGAGEDDQQDKENKKKSRLQIQAEEIEEKIRRDAHYLPTRKETAIRRKWNLQLEKQCRAEMERKKKAVSKKNTQMKKRRNAQTTIPKTTQKSIPYIADYDEGLFEVRPNKYSKIYRMQDINYHTGKEEEQITIFCKLGEFLNYFSDDMSFSFCIDNRIISVQEQEKQIFYQMSQDGYDRHRKEYNNILRRQIMAGRNNIQVEKFVTVTIDASTPLEALLRFHKLDAEVIDNLRKIGSDAKILSTEERLAYYHDKYRKGREGELKVDFDFIKSQGISQCHLVKKNTFYIKNMKSDP